MKATKPIFGSATVATAGTAVQLGAAYAASVQAPANTPLPIRKLLVIADRANSGRILFGDKTSRPVSLAAGDQLPIEFPEYHQSLDLLDYWVDASANGQILNFVAFLRM